MAEPFGILAGSLSIAALFTTCVDCFEYIQLGRNFGKDYQTSQLKLDIARVRLSRWGNAVNVNCDPNVQNVMATMTDAEMAKNVLGQILDLFVQSEKISQDYRPKAKPGELVLYDPSRDMEPTLQALHNKMRSLAKQRQKKASLMQKTAWALYQRKHLDRLVDDITELVDGLETIVPIEAIKRRLAEIEITEIPDEPSLQAIEAAAEGVDSVLQQTATTAIEKLNGGHVFRNIEAQDDAMMRNGNEYNSGYVGSTSGAGNVYDQIKARGKSRVHNGNVYGGRSILDD